MIKIGTTYDDENAREGMKHKSCYGKIYGEDGNDVCLDGELGLCKYWLECEHDNVHYLKQEKICYEKTDIY